MISDKKHREFWIVEPGSLKVQQLEVYKSEPKWLPDGDKMFHVIEHEAYEKLKSDLKIAVDALNEIKAYGHSENCRIMKPYRDHYRCTFEEAEEALKKIEGEK